MKRRRSALWLLAVYVVLAVVTTLSQLVGLRLVADVGYVLLMPALIAFVFTMVRRRTRPVTLTVVALFWSWMGDWADSVLLVKIIFFLLAQIAYAAAFWPMRRRSVLFRPVPLLAYLALIAFLIATLASRAGSLTGAVAGYGVLLGVMAVLATGVNRTVGLGAFVFLLSDIVLAVHLFVGPDVIPLSLALNSALYLPAQLLIVVGVLRWAAEHPVGQPPLFAQSRRG